MANVVVISGSPSKVSRSATIANFVGELVQKEGNHFHHLQIRDLPAEDLVYAKFDSQAIQQAKNLIAAADAVIVVSPVYKASYTGIFKTFFDLLPEKALAGKTILPIANGGTSAHLLSIEFAFKPLLSILGATDIIDGVFIVDSQVQYSETELKFVSDEVEQRLRANVNELLSRLTKNSKTLIEG